MKELVEVIAKALVDHPEEVTVTEKNNGKNIVIELHVAPSDMGKVVGKQGRIAKSIRSVVKAVSSTKSRAHVDVEIVYDRIGEPLIGSLLLYKALMIR